MHKDHLTAKKKKFRSLWITTPVLAVCAVFAYLLTSMALFPSYIQVMEGQDTQIYASFPFSIETEGQIVAVTSNQAQMVKDNITIDTDENITKQAGGGEMALSLFGIPVKSVSVDVIPATEVVPCGMTVGVKIHTDGVMVLGTGSVESKSGETVRPSENKLKSGDLILQIDGQKLKSQEELIQIIEESKEDTVTLRINRNGEAMEIQISPAVSSEDGKRKIGVWVRDSTQGIGTLTYYNPDSHSFGALGHGIMDVDTKKLMSVKDGTLTEASVVSVKKGEKGHPGELEGVIRHGRVIGEIKLNTLHGLYGLISQDAVSLPKKALPICLQNEIHEGPAKILSNVRGDEIKEYDVYIESVNKYSADDSKGMVVKITDKDLLTKTNGIVQGMSGSPIIQDGRLIGAVTHVFVQNPTKGYGIFIENMLKQEKGI